MLVRTPSSLLSSLASLKSNTVSVNGIAGDMSTSLGDAIPRISADDTVSRFETESTGMMSVPSSEAGVGAGRGTGICVGGAGDGEACTMSSIVGVAEASWVVTSCSVWTDATLFEGETAG